AEFMKDFIMEKSEESKHQISEVVVDGQSINDMDTTALETLQMMVKDLKKMGIKLHFAGLKGPVRDVMLRSGVARKMGGQYFHLTPDKAVIYILKQAKKQNPDDHRIDDYL